MKKTCGQRWLSLLLTLAMCLTLAPAAFAAEDDTMTYKIRGGPTDGVIEPNSTTTLRLVAVDASGNETEVRANLEWGSSDTNIAAVHYSSGLVTAGSNAGEVKITAFVNNKEVDHLDLTVKGIAVRDGYDPFVIYENDDPKSMTSAIQFFGGASSRSLYFTSRDSYTAEIVSETQVRGVRVGETTVEAVANDGRYRVTFTVRVDPDKTTDQKLNRTMKSGEALPFSGAEISAIFNALAGGNMRYVTGLYVPTDQGTLYYNYKSEAEPGAGVGQIESYYRNPSPGQRALSDITFVAKPGYIGGNAVITYTAVTEDGRTYSCKITITIQGSSSAGDDAQGGSLSYTTEYNTPVKFDSIEFGAVCREKLGTQLDYVIFAQPPERQGALYTNYSSSGSYGSLVDVHKHYSRKEIDDIWFVPTPGYSNGTVTIYYTGFGTNGRSYSGQVIIRVEEEDQIATGGLSYNVAPGGVVRFDDDDFDDYCYNLLNHEQHISGIRFESLPSESGGILYYDYRSSTNTGARALAGTVYYPGTRAPRIDRLAFVAAEDFTGTLKFPFTGWTTDGTSFSGTLEINVHGSNTVSGDIYYYCAPGGTVTFQRSDFISMSNTLTGRTLDYIRFRGLPSTSEGYLYYGNSRITSTGTNYTSGNIDRLSFRASRDFSGLVTVSFEGRSTGGDTFTGVIAFGSGGYSSGSTSSSGSDRDIRYYTDSRSAAVFYRDDFDNLSLWETDRSISSVRFDPPSSSQGSLYQNYRSSSSMGTRLTSSTSITAGNLDRVAFVPASGYTGTVYIGFTATASGGSTFTGEVEITVSGYGSYYFSDMAGYSSAQQAAVDFLYDRGITHGLTVGQYGPESSIRRGDFALMLYQAFGFSPISYGGSFVDVSSGAYYATAVDTLYANGVVSGVGGGRYAPDSTLTRQDAICMVQRAMRATGRSAGDGYASVLAGYSDSGNVSDYAQGAMALAIQRGILPTNGSWLNPQMPLTRVDMAEILYRVLTY